jgi:hypothetical protein
VPNPLSSQGWNGYSYGANNPINRIDPSGHCFLIVGVDTLACGAIWAFIIVGGDDSGWQFGLFEPTPDRNCQYIR